MIKAGLSTADTLRRAYPRAHPDEPSSCERPVNVEANIEARLICDDHPSRLSIHFLKLIDIPALLVRSMEVR
jgi:hypothetical protein